MPDPPEGRRQRKKQATRDALLTTARSLFATQGYATTTVRQISDGADVAERTFFRYFDAKEDLLLPEVEAVFDAITEAVRTRPDDEAPLAAILAATAAVWERDPSLTYLGRGVDQTEPAIAGRLVKVFMAWEERLAAVLVERLAEAGQPGSADDLELRANVIARSACAATRAAVRHQRLHPIPNTLGDPTGATALHACLRAAFATLAAGEPALHAALDRDPPASEEARRASTTATQRPSRSRPVRPPGADNTAH